MGQITATRNLVATKVVRLAGQQVPIGQILKYQYKYQLEYDYLADIDLAECDRIMDKALGIFETLVLPTAANLQVSVPGKAESVLSLFLKIIHIFANLILIMSLLNFLLGRRMGQD